VSESMTSSNTNTKVVILAGGRGTRIAEETHAIPKPMVDIGGRPIIWHIMKHYARYGFTDFVVACGYKGYVIKEYFTNYLRHQGDVTVNLSSGETQILSTPAENWTVTLADTGAETMTGGRIRRLRPFLDDRFLLTYGDGLSNVPIDQLVEHHAKSGATATVTAVSPPPRFGALEIADGKVRRFAEKPSDPHDRINGGFFVVEPTIFDLLTGDDCVFEREPLSTLARSGELSAFPHDGFWMAMDTVRERDELNVLARRDPPPWTE
jgi:glucose-1-phosphate cytidylyltransferase